jgi:twinkle protein
MPRDREPYEIQPPQALNMRSVIKDAMTEMAKPEPGTPLLAWKNFTELTGGFRPREYTIFCGPTGSGKTTFLANLSAQLLRQEVKHFVMSVETGHTDFMKRIMSVFAGRDLNTGEIVPATVIHDLLSKHPRELTGDSIEFSLYENRIPVEQLKHDLEFMAKERGCKIAMIDNLNFFLEVTSAKDAVVEMDRVTHELVVFCKQIDMHIIMVMHPKKGADGRTRIENEWDIKGSSTAVQEAHNIFFFNRPKKEDVESGHRTIFQRELLINKMRRRGQNWGKTIVFNNYGTRYEEKGFNDYY